MPVKLAQITLSMLWVRPQLRATVMEVFKALQGVCRGHVCRLRLWKKVYPNTPWQACLRSGVVHGGLLRRRPSHVLPMQVPAVLLRRRPPHWLQAPVAYQATVARAKGIACLLYTSPSPRD